MAKVVLTFEDMDDGTVNCLSEATPVPDQDAGVEALTPAQSAALMTLMYVQQHVFKEYKQESNDEQLG